MIPQKAIFISGHARQQITFRGTSEQEIVEAIQTETWTPAQSGRLECRKDFPFNSDWNGKYYTTKQVRPIFVDEPTQIVVVTVYTYFF